MIKLPLVLSAIVVAACFNPEACPADAVAGKSHRRFVLADESRAKVHLWDSDDPDATFEIPVEKPVWDLKRQRDGVYRIVCKRGFMLVDLFARKVVETFRHPSLDEVTAICDLPDGGFICSVNPQQGDPLYCKAVQIRRFPATRELVATYRMDGLFYARTMNPDRTAWQFLLAWEKGFVRFRINAEVKDGSCEILQSYPQPVGRNLFDAEGNSIWHLYDPDRFGSVSGIVVLDAPGKDER